MEEFQRALELLPHGPDFRFIDELVKLAPGKKGEAQYTLRSDAAFLRGHFPGEPLMPGVLLLEAAAQLAGVVAQSDPNVRPLEGLKLTAIRNAKILGTARPGERIELRAEITGRMEHLIQASVTADVNGKRVLESLLTLSGQRSII